MRADPSAAVRDSLANGCLPGDSALADGGDALLASAVVAVPTRWRRQPRGIRAFFAIAFATSVGLVAACFVTIPGVVESSGVDAADSLQGLDRGDVPDACSTVLLVEPVDARCPTSDIAPAMVALRSPTGTVYCIDTTEVSKQSYNGSYLTPPFLEHFDGSACAVDAMAQALPAPSAPLPGTGDVPAVINWCEADAFCRFVNRRLCSGSGGAALDDPRSSEWFNACSPDGRRFPFGADAAFSDCSYSQPSPVGARRCCVGSVRGVFDMSGNVAEWTGECVAVAGKPFCQVRALRGGSATAVPDAQPDERCTAVATTAGTTQRASGGANYAGVRCCADPLPP